MIIQNGGGFYNYTGDANVTFNFTSLEIQSGGVINLSGSTTHSTPTTGTIHWPGCPAFGDSLDTWIRSASTWV